MQEYLSQNKEFKELLFIYLVLHQRKQPTKELQYKLHLEGFFYYCQGKEAMTREECKKLYDNALETQKRKFFYWLPQDIKDEIEDWDAFAVGYISKEIWKKLKKFYEETYNEKLDMKRAGTH